MRIHMQPCLDCRLINKTKPEPPTGQQLTDQSGLSDPVGSAQRSFCNTICLCCPSKSEPGCNFLPSFLVEHSGVRLYGIWKDHAKVMLLLIVGFLTVKWPTKTQVHKLGWIISEPPQVAIFRTFRHSVVSGAEMRRLSCQESLAVSLWEDTWSIQFTQMVSWAEPTFMILLMEEILHHLGSIKPPVAGFLPLTVRTVVLFLGIWKSLHSGSLNGLSLGRLPVYLSSVINGEDTYQLDLRNFPLGSELWIMNNMKSTKMLVNKPRFFTQKTQHFSIFIKKKSSTNEGWNSMGKVLFFNRTARTRYRSYWGNRQGNQDSISATERDPWLGRKLECGW